MLRSALILVTLGITAYGLNNGLGLKPPMGWNSVNNNNIIINYTLYNNNNILFYKIFL